MNEPTAEPTAEPTMVKLDDEDGAIIFRADGSIETRIPAQDPGVVVGLDSPAGLVFSILIFLHDEEACEMIRRKIEDSCEPSEPSEPSKPSKPSKEVGCDGDPEGS